MNIETEAFGDHIFMDPACMDSFDSVDTTQVLEPFNEIQALCKNIHSSVSNLETGAVKFSYGDLQDMALRLVETVGQLEQGSSSAATPSTDLQQGFQSPISSKEKMHKGVKSTPPAPTPLLKRTTSDMNYFEIGSPQIPFSNLVGSPSWDFTNSASTFDSPSMSYFVNSFLNSPLTNQANMNKMNEHQTDPFALVSNFQNLRQAFQQQPSSQFPQQMSYAQQMNEKKSSAKRSAPDSASSCMAPPSKKQMMNHTNPMIMTAQPPNSYPNSQQQNAARNIRSQTSAGTVPSVIGVFKVVSPHPMTGSFQALPTHESSKNIPIPKSSGNQQSFAPKPIAKQMNPPVSAVPKPINSQLPTIPKSESSSKVEHRMKRRLQRLKRIEKKQKMHPGLKCEWCGKTDTPEWRRGPSGPDSLCNACGIRYSKNLKTSSS